MVNPTQLIDTGFVLFVTFTCGYSLFGNRDQTESRSKKWMHELAGLQETLKELIEEASAAGSILDCTLLKRKQELERILQRIETRVTESEELPNDSWSEQSRPAPRAPARNVQAQAPRSAQPAPRRAAPPVQQNKPVQPNREELPPARPRTMEVSPEQNSELARRIEILLEGRTPKRGSGEESIDPAAYKIARRLLEAGKEIHVVARKVGLPIDEVRMIDLMIPREAAELEAELRPEISEEESDQITERLNAAPTYSRAKRIETPRESDNWDKELNGLLEESELEIRRATTLL